MHLTIIYHMIPKTKNNFNSSQSYGMRGIWDEGNFWNEGGFYAKSPSNPKTLKNFLKRIFSHFFHFFSIFLSFLNLNFLKFNFFKFFELFVDAQISFKITYKLIPIAKHNSNYN